MADFEVNGKKYRNTRLDAFTQFHVMRRLGNIYPQIIGAISVRDKDPMLALGYITGAIGKLSDADAEFIVHACLGSTQYHQSGKIWVAIFTQGQLMFSDLAMQDMLEIVWRVLEDNFGPFIRALLSKFPEAKTTAKA